MKKIVGRTWDLKAAYKQFAVVTAHRYANVIVVFNPETGEPSYFVGAALPFGAKASVNGFCRAAMALRQLAVKILHLAGTNYFDDFPIVLETYRDCLRDVMDLPGLTQVLDGIECGEIRVIVHEA